MPSSPAGKQPNAAANIQGQNIEAAIVPQSAGPETVETFAASNQVLIEYFFFCWFRVINLCKVHSVFLV